MPRSNQDRRPQLTQRRPLVDTPMPEDVEGCHKSDRLAWGARKQAGAETAQGSTSHSQASARSP